MRPLKFDENGLITAVVQHADKRDVLMVAMMNAEAYALTRDRKLVHFWSRSRQKLWLKGETSGNFLEVKKMMVDCDGDALLLLVKPRGPACHTGEPSCFFTEVDIR